MTALRDRMKAEKIILPSVRRATPENEVGRLHPFDLNHCNQTQQMARKYVGKNRSIFPAKRRHRSVGSPADPLEKRLILLLTAVVFSGMGVLIALTTSPTYTGEIRVHRLNESEMAGFDA